MAQVSWDKFLPLMAPHLPGCPDLTMRQALAKAATEFCERTHLWREELDEELTVAGQANYQLFATSTVEKYLSFACNGTELTPTHPSMLSGDWRDATGEPTHYFLVNDAEIQLYPTPDAAYSLRCLAVIKPKATATGIDSFIYDAHEDPIASGAVARLMLTPGKDWSNPQLAVVHGQLFEKGIDNARARDLRSVVMRIAPTPI
jgi:hypothetical protein